MGSQIVTSPTAVSSELTAAQERLFRLRQAHQANRLSQSTALACGDHGRFLPSNSSYYANAETQNPGEQLNLQDCIEQLPLHLGWESKSLTAVLRGPEERKCDANSAVGDDYPQEVTYHTSPNTQLKKRSPFIKVYPSLAQGMLLEGQAAAGRVWLLLRYLDKNGRGWMTESEVQKHLTEKTSPTRLFGRRQWRNIIKKGTGIFWQRENGRLWLNSVSKTAAALGVWQLNGRPVQLPVSVLTEKIGTVRAHLYATFHSSRSDKTQPKPIARETLTAQFDITPRTQRRYERKARVKARQNYAIGKKETTENMINAAWQHGFAAFSFTDYQGKQGRPGTTYLAWQLPNHYVGPHQQACRGRQKRINRELADLFMKGMTGNGDETVDENQNSNTKAQREKGKVSAFSASPRFDLSRRFCGNGRLAAKVYNRNQAKQDVYWRSPGKVIWHVMEKN